MTDTILTCPFTGFTFEALEDDKGTLWIEHPITKEVFNAIKVGGTYIVPTSIFQHIEIVDLAEARKILDVSRQRIHQIADEGVIDNFRTGGKVYFRKDSVIKYSRKAKPGRPRKDNENETGDNSTALEADI